MLHRNSSMNMYMCTCDLTHIQDDCSVVGIQWTSGFLGDGGGVFVPVLPLIKLVGSKTCQDRYWPQTPTLNFPLGNHAPRSLNIHKSTLWSYTCICILPHSPSPKLFYNYLCPPPLELKPFQTCTMFIVFYLDCIYMYSTCVYVAVDSNIFVLLQQH